MCCMWQEIPLYSEVTRVVRNMGETGNFVLHYPEKSVNANTLLPSGPTPPLEYQSQTIMLQHDRIWVRPHLDYCSSSHLVTERMGRVCRQCR